MLPRMTTRRCFGLHSANVSTTLSLTFRANSRRQLLLQLCGAQVPMDGLPRSTGPSSLMQDSVAAERMHECFV